MDLETVTLGEASQKEEKQILHINTYMQNIEKWYRDTDIEKELVDTAGKGEEGTNGETRIDIYALPCVKQIASGNLMYSAGNSARCSVMTQMGGSGVWEGDPREGIYIHITVSLCCTAETNIVKQLDPNEKNKVKNKVNKKTIKFKFSKNAIFSNILIIN